jgi:hypothetical protein
MTFGAYFQGFPRGALGYFTRTDARDNAAIHPDIPAVRLRKEIEVR